MKFERISELQKEKSFEQQTVNKDQFLSQLKMRSSRIDHNRYGKMLVLLETNKILITLGPDYLCFLSAFVGFAVAGYFLAAFVNGVSQKTWVKILNILIVLTQQLAYLTVALSNPGVVCSQSFISQETTEEEQQTKRYCLKCKVKKSKDVQHCKTCDVCIRGFDHHCPWVSKCIGESNLNLFYFFVSFTPFYIIYFIIMMLVTLGINASAQNMSQ